MYVIAAFNWVRHQFSRVGEATTRKHDAHHAWCMLLHITFTEQQISYTSTRLMVRNTLAARRTHTTQRIQSLHKHGYAIGEYSAHLGESAVIRPISMTRREAGDGVTPQTVAKFEKIICKRVNEQRTLEGKPLRVERVQSSHGGRRGAVKNSVNVARQKGQVVDYCAVCKDLR